MEYETEQKQGNVRAAFKKFYRLIWCAFGAGAGISLALWFVGVPSSPYLLASLGGSTVFLFGLTRSPAAQPRALIGGHLGSALIGIACFQLFGDGLWVYTIAVVLVLLFMLVTKTVHPPAGADPLIMIHEHAGFFSLWQPVGLGVLVIAAITFVWSRISSETYHYPINWFEASPPSVHLNVWK